ncbi:MAG: inosine-5-monophosphate dehydrogenase [Flavobacteriales bacterium]|nr:MAG: inosine-5-monophosphate dehydrogenase [Flavobacteriales bacterium]
MVNFTPTFAKEEEKSEQIKRHESIRKYMTPATKLISFTPDQKIGEVIGTILNKKISGAPVLNDKKQLVGIISEKDCLKVIIDEGYHNLPPSNHTVSNYMTKNVKTISADKDVLDAADLFLKTNYRRYPVIDEKGKLVGQISRRDILRAAKAIKASRW